MRGTIVVWLVYSSYQVKSRRVFAVGQARRLVQPDETSAKSSETATGRSRTAHNSALGGNVGEAREDGNGHWTLNASMILGGPERQPDGSVKMVSPARLPMQVRIFSLRALVCKVVATLVDCVLPAPSDGGNPAML